MLVIWNILLFTLQIFRSLESPAEEDRVHELHKNVSVQREYLIGNVTKLVGMTDLRNMDHAISLYLEEYESVW